MWFSSLPAICKLFYALYYKCHMLVPSVQPSGTTLEIFLELNERPAAEK